MTIEAGSSVVMDEWIGDDNKKKVLDYAETDMLDVKNHPHVHFASNRVTKKPDGSLEVGGDLTIPWDCQAGGRRCEHHRRRKQPPIRG